MNPSHVMLTQAMSPLSKFFQNFDNNIYKRFFSLNMCVLKLLPVISEESGEIKKFALGKRNCVLLGGSTDFLSVQIIVNITVCRKLETRKLM